MLLRAIFLIALVALLAETILHAAASLASASLHARALDASRNGFLAAVASAQSAAAQAIQRGLDPRTAPLPTPLATCAASAPGGCAFSVTVTIASPTPGPAASPTACPQAACAVLLQANSAVDEARVAYHIRSVASGANGVALAVREGDVSFRTFASPPYATIVGMLDGSLDLRSRGTSDDGGAIHGSANTLVTVEYQQRSAPGTTPMPGNVWSVRDLHGQSTTPAWQP